MAEGYMRALTQGAGCEDVAVLSAGIAAAVGNSASNHAIQVLSKEKIDISKHQARQLEKAFLEASDLILTMTALHKQLILEHFPEYQKKVQTLAEASGIDGDIEDPFGGSEELYAHVAKEIQQRVELAWKKIQKEQGKTEK